MRRFASALVALTVLGGPSGVEAQDTQWNRYTLEKLGGVYVSAETSAQCESVGVVASQVRTDAAIKLLESEVDVLTEEEMLANPGLPELVITLECVAGERGSVRGAIAFSVSVRVNQATKMIRDEQVTLAEAVTWYATAVGVAEPDDAREALEEAVEMKLEEFATAYVEANPAEGGSRQEPLLQRRISPPSAATLATATLSGC